MVASRAQSHEFKDMVVSQRFAPIIYGATANLRCRRGGVEEAAFQVQKIIKDSGRKDPPTWAALERTPEQGRRRRAIRSIVDKARQACDMLEISTDATIYTGGLEAAKYNVDTNRRERRPAWQATGVNCERFEAGMQKW